MQVEKFACTTKLDDEFNCPICLCLVRDAIDCANCATLYCGKCFSDVKEVCPKMCGEKSKPQQPHRIIRNQLASLEFTCKDCPEVVKYGNLD